MLAKGGWDLTWSLNGLILSSLHLDFLSQGWPTEIHSRATQFVKGSREGSTCLYLYRKAERGVD
jgi:hypothetical protein